MIKQKIIIDKYSWEVYVYYDASKRNIDEIVDNIIDVNLPDSYIESAYTILNKKTYNNGITISNIRNKKSIIVFTKTSDASEFVNSFIHEIYHLVNHIARTYKISYDSEEICYLAGHIAQTMFRQCHKFMCDCCRNE